MKTSRSMWNLRVIAAAVVIGVACSPAIAERKVLQSDSFSGEATFTQLASFGELEIGAAVFTAEPGDYPFRIDNIQVLILSLLPGSIAMVSVTVWEDVGTPMPGQILHTSTFGFQVEGSTTLTNQLDLACENIIVTSGSVRVGIVWEYVGDPIGIAFDLDGITPGINTVYSDSLGGWQFAETLSVAGDWIFRLEIETDLGAAAMFADGFERGDQSCW